MSGERIRESDYKPLLMLLGSGRVSVESTQTAVDSTVILTTNIEEMELLDHQLTSSKLLDRIEKVPVNYLLDASSETDILRRDLANMREKYDVDPNLLRIASYYSVMTRLLPPMRKKFPSSWSQRKIELYLNITLSKSFSSTRRTLKTLSIPSKSFHIGTRSEMRPCGLV